MKIEVKLREEFANINWNNNAENVNNMNVTKMSNKNFWIKLHLKKRREDYFCKTFNVSSMSRRWAATTTTTKSKNANNKAEKLCKISKKLTGCFEW